jgi:succinate dehydrogenase / fumarate reductase cytochrome b subunit
MGWLLNSLNSSIGKKFVMAITGVCLLMFLIIHLIGNMTLYIGREAFTGYVEILESVKPLIRVIEVILALVFLLHIFNGVRLWYQNKTAKPIAYTVNAAAKNSTLFSRTMFVTGSIIFIFLVIHLQTIWYKYNFSGQELSLFDIVIKWFQVPWYSVLYVAAIFLMGMHLNHGFQSAFQTFGWNHNKYTPLIKALGTIYAIIMAGAFASIPIYFLFFYGGN